jgi:hypothetical protein
VQMNTFLSTTKGRIATQNKAAKTTKGGGHW